MGLHQNLSNHNANLALVGLLASDQTQRQPTVNVGCSVGEAMVPSQDAKAIGSRMLLADHSLIGWTTPWEVQENNASEAKASKCCAFGMIRVQDYVWIDC